MRAHPTSPSASRPSTAPAKGTTSSGGTSKVSAVFGQLARSS